MAVAATEVGGERYRVALAVEVPWTRDQFGDLVEGLNWGLARLDRLAEPGAAARAIVLCPHLLDAAGLARLPADAVLYNLEQITPSSQLPPSRLWAFRHWPIWDFSPRNIDRWADQGLAAAHVPIGWHPGLERIAPAPVQDLDVLFLGNLNHRRLAALERMRKRGLTVAAPKGVFGAERDALVARAKVVVNIHYYPTSLLETLRLAYLLANGAVVVSERSPRSEIPPEYEDAVCWSPYEDLAETCSALIADAGRRTQAGAAARAAMRAMPVARWLAPAIGATAVTVEAAA